MVYLPDYTINLRTNVVEVKSIPDRQFKLQRSETGQRERPKDSVRSRAEQFNMVRAIDNNFAQEPDEYGTKWSLIYKNRQKHGVPSPNEVIKPLERFFVQRLEGSLDDNDPKKETIIQQYQAAFEKVKELFLTEEADAPCMRLHDPTNRTACMVLWLLSLEPGFYAELNLACSDLVEDLLDYFGPFARAVHLLTERGEAHRPDPVIRGSEVEFNEKELGTFRGSFVLFRGTRMPESWVQQWLDLVGRETQGKRKKMIADFIRLQGFTSANLNPEVALRFATCSREQLDAGLRPVIFVICLQNYGGFKGFRMDKP